MKSLHRLLILALSIASLSVLAIGCDKPAETGTDGAAADGAAAEETAAAEISVDELAGLIDSKAEVTICDANGEETRKEHGVIPGAVLMSSYEKLDVLPESKDAKLVFYCGSEKCSAAPKAAEKALAAGYKDVKVLKAGIKGWKAAGKPTEKVEEKG